MLLFHMNFFSGFLSHLILLNILGYHKKFNNKTDTLLWLLVFAILFTDTM